MLFTFTVFVEPLPFPEIITVVPLAEGEGFTEGDDDGEAVGEVLGVGELLGAGVADGEGIGDEEGFIDGETDTDGLGKLAAAVKELPRFLALLENDPKTDWLSAKNTKQIKNENIK